MKARVRFNTKVQAWECKFDENGSWYLTGKDQNQDNIWKYKYRVLKYQVKRVMNTLAICDFDIYPFALNLKEDLGFDKTAHNVKAVVRIKEIEVERSKDEELKKEEDAKKREVDRIERERKRLESANQRNNKRNNKHNNQNQNRVVHQKLETTTFELNVRKDIINGMTKRQIKIKYKISNDEYRRYKQNAITDKNQR